MNLSQQEAFAICQGALFTGHKNGLNPLTFVCLDQGGNMKYMTKEDGSSLLRQQIAQGKAYGALTLFMDSAKLGPMAADRPAFVNSAIAAANQSGLGLVPVAGGVVVRRKSTGEVIGACGVSGDLSPKDEACVIAGIRAAAWWFDVTCEAIEKKTPCVLDQHTSGDVANHVRDAVTTCFPGARL